MLTSQDTQDSRAQDSTAPGRPGWESSESKRQAGGRHHKLKLTQQNKTSDHGVASHGAGTCPEERNTRLGSERGYQQVLGAVCKDNRPPEAEAHCTKAARESP